MTRPQVSVVMPFAGSESAAQVALQALGVLDVMPQDELILVDNSDHGEVASLAASVHPAVRVVRATAEHSPAHARNAGALEAVGEWILFVDADCRPRPGLLASYFEPPPAREVGALAGEVVAAEAPHGAVARYGAVRSFLSQEAHLAHPYRPRAAAANLLVRREAFLALGGFFEGLRAGEDTDFSWRLQQAGWRLELRRDAWVAHTYRSSLRELRAQWRGYAAGRAWLARRYEGFRPRPALLQALARGGRRSGRLSNPGVAAASSPSLRTRLDRPVFLLLDAVLAVEELIGFALSNRPPSQRPSPPEVVLLADRFPAAEDPLVELATTLEHVRVLACRRPDRVAPIPADALGIDYVDLDLPCPPHSAVRFTFFWTAEGRWEGRDYIISVEG